MEQYEEFSLEGKNIMYIDFSNLMTNEEFTKLIDIVKPVIAKYKDCSLYTITNVEDVRYDSFTREIFINYVEHNRPYVKTGVLIGIDGVKKMIVNTLVKLTGRGKFHITFTKEKAIEWILQQD
jgi:hypothetical protein